MVLQSPYSDLCMSIPPMPVFCLLDPAGLWVDRPCHAFLEASFTQCGGVWWCLGWVLEYLQTLTLALNVFAFCI